MSRAARMAVLACALLPSLLAPVAAWDGLSSSDGRRSAGALAPASASAKHVTIVAGRSFLRAVGPRCTPYAEDLTVDLLEVAKALGSRARPLRVHGTLQGAYTGTTRLCAGGDKFGAVYPSWSDLAALRDQYGWSFGNNGRDTLPMPRPGRTRAEQWNTSCGALRDLRAHGHDRGWALFAYPEGGNAEDIGDEVQAEVVSRCFAFGRRYDDLAPFEGNQRSDQGSRPANPLGWLWVHETYGGRCHLTGAPCASEPVFPERSYDSPDALATLLQPRAGEWSVLQFHAFVTGSRLSGEGSHWDCRSVDWRAHWSSRPELYCWQDFLRALDAVPPDAAVVDPAAAAAAWGRTMPPPELNAAAPSSGRAGTLVTLTGRSFRPVGSSGDDFISGKGFEVTFGAVPSTVTSVGPTSVKVVVPRLPAPGPVPLTVTNADGTRVVARGLFTVR